MHVNLLFDWLSIGELLTFKTGPPCIFRISIKFESFLSTCHIELTSKGCD